MAEETTAAPAAKGKMGIIKLAGISVLGLGVAADIGLRAVSYFKHAPAAEASVPAAGAAGDGHGSAPAAHAKIEAKSMMNLDAFLVNLADKESPRFLKATLRLGLDDEKLGEELTKEGVPLAITRDAVISVLSAKTSEQIVTLEGKETLRNEIRTKVNAVLPKGRVTDVFFVDFVVQF